MSRSEADLDADAILAELEAEGEQPRDQQHPLNSRSDRDGDAPSTSHQTDRASTTATTSSSQGTGFARQTVSRNQPDYLTLKSDDSTLQFTTTHARCVVHFFHPNFARCSIMDDHLTLIAGRHGVYGGAESSGDEDLAFARVDVGHAPFVVEKLGVRVLPAVLGFVGGVVKGRVVGFEGICWDGREKDVKVARALEESMVDCGVLRKRLLREEIDSGDDSGSEADEKRRVQARFGRRGIQGRKQRIDDDGDDWD